MDHSADTPPELLGEYGRALLATRVAGTVLILLAAGWCALQHDALEQGWEIIENMVTGGMDAMPALTQLVFKHGSTLAAIAALCSLTSLVMVWLGGSRISRVIYATTAGATITLLIGMIFNISWSGPFTQIMTNFRG